MDKQTKSAAKRGRKGKAGGNPSTARDTECAQENGHLKVQSVVATKTTAKDEKDNTKDDTDAIKDANMEDTRTTTREDKDTTKDDTGYNKKTGMEAPRTVLKDDIDVKEDRRTSTKDVKDVKNDATDANPFGTQDTSQREREENLPLPRPAPVSKELISKWRLGTNANLKDNLFIVFGT